MTKSSTGVLFVATAALAFGCGPSARDHVGDDGDDSGADASTCTPTAATETSCNNGFDDDCDGFLDCFDVDCINHVDEGCPSTDCGEAVHTEPVPLALPDDGTGLHPYLTSINITGFTSGQRLDDVNKLLGICVTMEHTWLRDLEIDAICPSGQTITMQAQLGNVGGEVYMGIPNDNDGIDPVPGVGWEYCWSPNAAKLPTLDYVNANPAVHDLPASTNHPQDDYQASTTFSPFTGCTLNGDWQIKVLDKWAIDNGFIFDWSVKFDSSLVSDCTDWPPTE